MPYKVERLPEEPIILISIFEPHDGPREIPEIHAQTARLASDIEGPVTRIVDMTESGLTFSQVVMALQAGSRKSEGGVTDQRFRSMYVVPTNMSKLLTDSLKQEQYGGIVVETFDARQEALDAARSPITEQPQK